MRSPAEWFRVLNPIKTHPVLPKPTLGEKAVARALEELGTKEYPANSNRQKYGTWYGFNGVPWCAIFVTYIMVQVGSKNWAAGKFTPSVAAISDAASAKEHGLAFTLDPQPGALAVYGVDEHVEFFQYWVNRKLGVFKAVGGNTASGDGSYNNGGEVASKNRYVAGNAFQKPVRFVAVS